VQHLLHGDLADRRPPTPDLLQLRGREPLAEVVLHAELREQVAAEHVVLDLRRLGQQIDELGPVLDTDSRQS
jgi:hypothetical protein